jgi:hypothetical protein
MMIYRHAYEEARGNYPIRLEKFIRERRRFLLLPHSIVKHHQLVHMYKHSLNRVK